jgi:hypothetical protein
MASVRFPVLLLTLAAFSSATPAQRSASAPPPAACTADLDSAVSIISRDYAGFSEKTRTPGRAAALAALTDSVRHEVRAEPAAEVCTAALNRWIAFFRDPHLQLWQSQNHPVEAPATSRPSAPPPSAYSVTYPDDSTAVLELRDFGQRHKQGIDSLVAAHRSRLLATPYLVIDVRRNGGGWTESYASVLPLLYTGPIHVDGMEVWASEGNLEYVRGMLASPGVPETLKEQLRPVAARMADSIGRFVTITDDRVIRMDTVHPLPRRVAVLTSRQCGSTCEQFVLDARQSRKVTVMGTANTRGMMDYGNVRRVALPSGVRQMQVPTSRSMRLPETALDVVGIAPDVRIPDGEADPVTFAVHVLRARR